MKFFRNRFTVVFSRWVSKLLRCVIQKTNTWHNFTFVFICTSPLFSTLLQGQTCFDLAEDDMIKCLEELKKKQASVSWPFHYHYKQLDIGIFIQNETLLPIISW